MKRWIFTLLFASIVQFGDSPQATYADNLPWPSFPALPFLDHTQYKTIVLKHESNEQNFEHSGTNSFTAKIDVDSSEGH